MQSVKKFTLLAIIGIFSAELFYFYISMLKASISSLSGTLIHSYGLSAPQLSLIASAFYFTALFLKIPAGIIVDRYGPKYPLILSVLITSLGVLWFSQSSTFTMFLFSRALLAVGYGCALLAAVKIFVMYLPQRWYAFLIGSTLFCGYLGASFAGLPLIKILETYPNWSHIFFIISMLGFAIAIMMFISLDNQHEDEFVHHRTLWNTVCESFSLLRNPKLLALACYTGVIVSGAICTADLWGKLYLTKVSMVSPEMAAFASTTMIYLGISIGSFMWGSIQSAFQCGRITLFFIAIFTALTACVFFFVGLQSVIALSIAGFILGALSASKVVCYDLARKLVDYKNLAVVVALLAMSVTAMGAVIQVLIGYVFHIASAHFDNIPAVYNTAVATIPIVLLLTALIALTIKVEPKE